MSEITALIDDMIGKLEASMPPALPHDVTHRAVLDNDFEPANDAITHVMGFESDDTATAVADYADRVEA